MTLNTTRLHKTWFQEVNFLKNSKILTKWSRGSVFRGRIHNMGWTHVESTSKIIIIDVENSSFGYNLIVEIWISEGLGLLAWGCLGFWNLSPGSTTADLGSTRVDCRSIRDHNQRSIYDFFSEKKNFLFFLK